MYKGKGRIGNYASFVLRKKMKGRLENGRFSDYRQMSDGKVAGGNRPLSVVLHMRKSG